MINRIKDYVTLSDNYLYLCYFSQDISANHLYGYYYVITD